MLTLVKQFVEICLFQSKPQDLPASQSVLVTAAGMSILSNVLVATSLFAGGTDTGTASMLFLAIGQVIIFAAVVWVVLRIKSRAERWRQTVAALLGTGALFQLILLPLLSWHSQLTGEYETFVLAPSLPMLLAGVVGAWSIAVATYVMRQALEATIGAALLLTIVCFFVSQVLLEILLHPLR